MSGEEALQQSNFDDRLRRARGRSSRNVVASAKVTRQEHEELENAARLNNKALSEWAREVLLREARRMKDDPLFTEVVSMKLLLLNLLKPIAIGQKITPEQVTEILMAVRKGKRQAAQETMQQYTLPQGKEG